MNEITANDLRIHGISAINKLADKDDGVMITVRGKKKYIVISIEAYTKLLAYELDAAIQEAKNDIAQGRYDTGSVQEHINRISDV